MSDITHISTSGGLMTASFIEALRAERCAQPGTAPETFAPRSGAPAPRPLELSGNLGTAWELLLEKWDAVRGRLKEMDVSTLRGRWLSSFFDVLEYDLVFKRGHLVLGEGSDALRFPLYHRGWEGEGAPIIHIVAPSPVPVRVLDARSEGRGARSPHDLLQLYLNRSADKWGIVTDGVFVRLLRDFHHTYTRGYVEFDLESIFESRSFADFRALYRLLHASRFVPSGEDGIPLERFYSASQAAGVAVGTELKANVRRAIEALGNGFLATARAEDVPRDEAGMRAFYAEVLMVVYRILFLLFAEQREMMPGRNSLYAEEYSIAALRDRAAGEIPLRDHHSDLWEGLRVTFRMVERGVPELQISSYNGMLFDERHTERLNQLSCPNSALLAAVRDLTLVQKGGVLQRISYADLGVEEIGSIYESLLDYTPRVAACPEEIEKRRVTTGEFFLDPRSSARKTSGSYYTHPQLVNALIQSALKPVVEERLQTAGSDQKAREQAILALKVCDPACGSAHFLVAATDYLGQELARVRARDDYPPENVLRQARRDILSHCIYGVDVNPMAVELAKVALWINCAVKDLPLNFLDHRIKCGNGLIGATPELLATGVPDAAFDPVAGDDKKVAQAIKRRNKEERNGALPLPLESPREAALGSLATEYRRVGELAETDRHAVHRKAKRYDDVIASESHQHLKHVADAWCAAFFWPLADGSCPVPTHAILARLQQDPDSLSPELESRIETLATTHRFFHWHLEFPEVFDSGGFDCVLGNPPWERIELQEREFFAVRDPGILRVTTKAERQARIDRLRQENGVLTREFEGSRRSAESQSKFVRRSGRFPLTGSGHVNTYAVFAEHFRNLLSPRGYAGLICPTGIATDDSTKAFFSNLVSERALVGLVDFENREGLFPSVDSRFKFAALAMARREIKSGRYAFFLTNPQQLRDERRCVELTTEDMTLLNPNTRTCPVLRTRTDADLIKGIYRRVPVLVDETEHRNDWGFDLGTLFYMTTDSDRFRAESGEGLLPLYEGKMVQAYDHRAASVVANPDNVKRPGQPLDTTLEQHADPRFSPDPQFWVAARDVDARIRAAYRRTWFLGLKRITSPTNERTLIASLFPYSGASDSMPVIFTSVDDVDLVCCLYANLNALVLDYVVKQKIGGVTLNLFILKQFPVLPPDAYSPDEIAFVARRVLELVYTAWDLEPFARDTGYEGPPFRWDEWRRAHLRAQLDAFYFHKYGLSEEETRYVLDPKAVYGEDFPSETFRVLKENEIKKHVEYRTQRLVLEYYRAWADGDMRPFEALVPATSAAIRVVPTPTPTRQRVLVAPNGAEPVTRAPVTVTEKTAATQRTGRTRRARRGTHVGRRS